MIVCDNCGGQNEPTARYCGDCGNIMPGAAAAGAPDESQSSIQARQPTRRPGQGAEPRPSAARDNTDTVPATAQVPRSGSGVAATLDPATIRVEPGGNGIVRVRVVNLSRVVDEFAVQVIGEAAAWSEAVPQSVSLFPAATGTVEIHIRPPRTRDATAGALPLGIQVRSVADSTKQVHAQGLLEVGVFEDISTRLVPRTSHGTRSAVHELTVENHGNRVARLDITATDPDQILTFAISPSTTQLRPGESFVSRIRLQAANTKWRGTPELLPFQVSANPDIGERVIADGTFSQRPVLPPWLGKGALAAVGVVGALVLGFAVLPSLLAGPPASSTGGSAVAVLPTPVVIPTPRRPGGGGGGGNRPSLPTPTATPTPTVSPTPTPTPTPSPTDSPAPEPGVVLGTTVFDSAPAISSWGLDRYDVFGRATLDGAVWWGWNDGAGWQCCQPIDPSPVQFRPAAISWGPDRIDVFAVGTDSAMYHQVWDGFAWSGWMPIGGSFMSAPTVASWAPGRLDVFGQWFDGTLYHSQTDDGTIWSEWTQVDPSPVDGAPAAVARGFGLIEVFARRTDGQIYQQTYTDTIWSGWRPIPGLGDAKSGPAVSAWLPDHLDLFVRGSDETLWHTVTENGVDWLAWQQVDSAQFRDGPAAVASVFGRIDVITRSRSDDLFRHRWYDGAWHPP